MHRKLFLLLTITVTAVHQQACCISPHLIVVWQLAQLDWQAQRFSKAAVKAVAS
jgi:hypothetical protein